VGTDVTLTATPSTESRFAGWSGAGLGTGTCQLTLSDDETRGAQFDSILRRPDGLIGSVPSGPYVGGNIYNLDGSEQTRSLEVKKNKGGSFSIQIQNDGDELDSIVVSLRCSPRIGGGPAGRSNRRRGGSA
jgi:Divergent InlB B-repeat domain